VTWTWSRGAATAVADFADPVHSSATYRVCLYDGSGRAQPLLEADVPPGGTCGSKPCWKATGTSGFAYRNKAGTPDGVITLSLKAGLIGKAKVRAMSKGPNLPAPTILPLTLPITAQLVIVDGVSTECWQTTFTTVTADDAASLNATGP